MFILPLRTRTFYKYKSCADEGGAFDRVMDSIRGKYLYITRATEKRVCRLANINRYLHELIYPARHVNFI